MTQTHAGQGRYEAAALALAHPEDEVPLALHTLSERQQKFCQFYALYSNGAKAALLAGYSPGSETSLPPGLLRKPAIQAGIAYFKEVYGTHTMYTGEKVLHQWATMASFDILDCCEDDYSLKPLHALTEDQRARLGTALVGLEVIEKGGKRFVKPQLAKAEALKELGKLLRLYGETDGQGQGLHLNITMGHHVHAPAGEASAKTVGHLRISTDPAEMDSSL